MLANEKESEEEYNNLIAKADAQLLEKSFNESIINYKKALKIKPNESHPTEQIKVAEQGIKDQIASSENDRKYENILKTADILEQAGIKTGVKWDKKHYEQED